MQTIATVDKHFYKVLGNYIRNIREKRSITLKEVAEQTGYSRPLINHWELGRNKIQPRQLKKVLKALGVENIKTINLAVTVPIGDEDV